MKKKPISPSPFSSHLLFSYPGFFPFLDQANLSLDSMGAWLCCVEGTFNSSVSDLTLQISA